MSWSPSHKTRSIALLLIITVFLGTAPSLAVAETRSGGSVVVAEGETVADLTAYGGTIIIRGTVEGDLTAIGGNVMIAPGAEVTGDVEATGGNIRIAGAVGGDVSTTGGNVFVASTATVDGNIEAAAGAIVIAGAVGGNAALAGGSITLASTATVDGNVEYATGEDGAFRNDGATIGGSVTQNEDLSVGGGGFESPNISGPIFGIYGFLVNLVMGAFLLLVLPGTAERIAGRVKHAPLRTGAIGLGALIGVPIGLGLVAITIIGIPITIAGLMVYVLLAWIATIYGRYAIGVTLLSYTDIENRWVALLVGLIVVAALVRIPVIGGVFELLVLLLGFGAVVELGVYFFQRKRGSGPATVSEEATPA